MGFVEDLVAGTRHVALLIEATNAYARGVVRGVAQYNHERAHWAVYFEPHALDSPLPGWLRTWKGDGILARIASRRTAKAVLVAGVPVVDLRRVLAIPGIPSIGPDNQAVARLAAAHLRERGFRHFGFCGVPPGDPPMDDRTVAFRRCLGEAGYACHVFEPHRNATWDQEQKRIEQWIRSLPKPAGVMTCHDERGLQVLRACARTGVVVPDEVAVIGVGNDDCLCNLAQPPLSSVDLVPRLIGYEAAALLDLLMDGRPPPSPHILVPPRGIVTRLSTDVIATEDQVVAQAMAFIRGHACQRIRIRDVLNHVKLSRSALEPRLKRVVGRTIHQEIARVRIDRAKELLSETDLPTKQVAAQTGFRSVQYLARVFHKATDQTPACYRKQTRS
jgi:LacI family transcriptional regulator